MAKCELYHSLLLAIYVILKS